MQKKLVKFDSQPFFAYTKLLKKSLSSQHIFFMQSNWFRPAAYIQHLQQQIQAKLSACDKLYFEITGNLIDQSKISALIPGFSPEMYKTIFAEFKNDMEIFFCVTAQDILDNKPFDQDGRPFITFLEIYLKKIENKFGTRPHIVINLIDLEDRYDRIFSFEQKFQKLWYRVREKYKIKAYSYDITKVISEDGFGNDDHIPTSKKLILIASLTPESGKLATAITQIYLNQEIDLNADYAKLEVLPNYSLPKDHPLNTIARKIYLQETEGLEFDTTLPEKDLYDRGLEKHAFIQKVFGLLKKPIPARTEDYLLGQLNVSDFDEAWLREKAWLN